MHIVRLSMAWRTYNVQWENNGRILDGALLWPTASLALAPVAHCSYVFL